jgi:hypothetical protein
MSGRLSVADFFDKSMPMISLWQPWASLLFEPETKLHETRSRAYPMKYHGERIAIHATQSYPSAKFITSALDELCQGLWGVDWRRMVPLGSVLGTVRLNGCFRTDEKRDDTTSVDIVAGDWSGGRFAWALADRRLLPAPIAAKGGQGWRRWVQS